MKITVNTKQLEYVNHFKDMDIDDEEQWGISGSNTRSSGTSADDTDTSKTISISDLSSLLESALSVSDSQYRLELLPVQYD